MKRFFGSIQKLDKKITVQINWALILFYAAFISYGYFSAMTSSVDEALSSPIFFIWKNASILLSLFLFGYMSINYDYIFRDKISFCINDILAVIVISLIVLINRFPGLETALIADEIAYSSVSFAYSNYISSILINLTSALDNIKYANIVQFVSVCILGFFILASIFLNKFTLKKRLFILAFILITIRVLVLFINGNAYPHPPLHLMPTLLFGTLFGLDGVMLKLAFFSGYVFFIFSVYKILLRRGNKIESFLLTLCIVTIPLLLNFSIKIEHSLWGAIAFILVLLDIQTAKKINYVRMFSFVSIFAMMRMPVFIATIPLILHYFFYKISYKSFFMNRKKMLLNFLQIISPVALFLPFLINSIIVKTPSTNSDGRLENMLFNIQSGVIYDSAIAAIQWPWLVLAIIPFIFSSSAKKLLILIITFLALVGVFFSIDTILLFEVKYKIEWLLPFSVLGILIISSYFLYSKILRKLIIPLSIALTSYNVYQYQNILNFQIPIDDYINNYSIKEVNEVRKRPIYDFSYDYNAAYDFIKNNNLQGQTLSVGVTYGVFSELLQGYNTKDYREASSIYETNKELNKASKVPWTSASTDIINENNNINFLVVGHMFPNKVQFISNMTGKGWEVEKEFLNIRYGSTVYLLKRK